MKDDKLVETVAKIIWTDIKNISCSNQISYDRARQIIDIVRGNDEQTQELLAQNEELREGLNNAADLIAEWGNYADVYFQEKHGLDDDVKSIRELANKHPKQSLVYIKSAVARETIEATAKDIATEFYYHWHNSGGTNTADGFDDWWLINKERFMPRKYQPTE